MGRMETSSTANSPVAQQADVHDAFAGAGRDGELVGDVLPVEGTTIGTGEIAANDGPIVVVIGGARFAAVDPVSARPEYRGRGSCAHFDLADFLAVDGEALEGAVDAAGDVVGEIDVAFAFGGGPRCRTCWRSPEFSSVERTFISRQ